MISPALFLDRDGTLIESRHYLSDPAEVVLMPGVREGLHRFMADGYRLFLFTNQSGVGRGFFPLEAVHRCNERMLELLDLPLPRFTEICIAPETPEMPAVYRKPSPRFIHEMVRKYALNPAETWMIGDMPCDVQAGLNAGVRTAMIKVDPAATVPAGAWHCRDWFDFEKRLRSEDGPALLPGNTVRPLGAI
jgi:D-glycero-D-manno-heptose 1,7-bisphosphate phosphatase